MVTNAVRRMRRASEVVAMPTGSGRWEALWIGLLAAAQLTDVVTTWLNLAHGNVEANPQAAAILSLGGIWLLWLSKLALVAAIAIVMVLARRAHIAHEATHVAKLVVRLPHFVAIRGTQLAVLVLTAISVSNALLLPSHL